MGWIQALRINEDTEKRVLLKGMRHKKKQHEWMFSNANSYSEKMETG